MSEKGTVLYSGVLHAFLIALAASTLLLARQNRALEQRLTPKIPPPSIVAGDTFEPFIAHDLEGREIRIGDDPAGARDRLLFIFTTTCGACQENQEKWRAIHAAAGDRYAIVGVSLDPREVTRQYSETLDLPFDIVTVPDSNAFAEQYRVDLVPLTLHVDAGGEVQDSWVGVLSEQTTTSL